MRNSIGCIESSAMVRGRRRLVAVRTITICPAHTDLRGKVALGHRRLKRTWSFAREASCS